MTVRQGVASALGLVVVFACSGFDDLRVTPDNVPGSYARIDGESDGVQAACATRRRQQVEPSVAVDPRNPDVIAVAAMDACHAVRFPVGIPQPYHWMSLFRSKDGGRTWRASMLPGYSGDSSSLAASQPCGLQADPTVDFDNEGRLFVAGICFPGGVLASDFGVGLATFDKGGENYVGTARVDRHSSPDEDQRFQIDRPFIAVDRTSGPNAGNVYAVWEECARPGTPCGPGGGEHIVFGRSKDHGRTFSDPVTVPPPPGDRTTGFSDVAVGPDGTVYLAFRTATQEERRAFWVTRSTDAGASFSPPRMLDELVSFDSYGRWGGATGNSECGSGPFSCATQFTYPAFSSVVAVAADTDGVHVVYSGELPSGQARVFAKSSPDGLDWSAPARQVDSAPAGHQWWPDVTSADGVLSVAFLDSRADPAYAPDLPPGNTRDGRNPGPGVHAYVAQSRDGGRTWSAERLTSVPSQPNYETYVDARVPWYGDFLSISAVPGGAVAAWPDSRDVLAGPDARAGNVDNGFDVLAPCPWDPNSVNPSPPPPVLPPADAYAAPAYTDPCLDQGGLDLNVYLAPVAHGALDLTVRPRRARRGVRRRFRVRVTAIRAGRQVPVAGARVRLGRRTVITTAGGVTRPRVRFRKRGRRRVVATAPGLLRDVKRVRVRARPRSR